VVGARYLTDAAPRRLTRWLWFLAAYLFVIVLVLWLAGFVPAPTSPRIGWAE
jgi:hypothetical protein